jgi:hypothetical protein
MIALLCVVLCQCKEDEGDEGDEDVFTLDGAVTSEGQPVEGADVSIDDEPNVPVRTDGQGMFHILGLTRGLHTIRIQKQLGDTDAAEVFRKTALLNIIENTLLAPIILPAKVVLSETGNISSTEVELTWNKADDQGFEKYTLLRYNTDDLTDPPAVIYSSAIINKTSYQDRLLLPGTSYHYQLIISYDGDGEYVTNVIATTTQTLTNLLEDGQLIQNHSFEKIKNDNNPLSWQVSYFSEADPVSVRVDNTIASDGGYSLKFTIEGQPESCWGSLQQDIPEGLFVANAEYEFSFDYKADFNYTTDAEVLILTGYTGDVQLQLPVVFQQADGWKSASATFKAPAETSGAWFQISFCVPVAGSWNVDNVRLKQQ